MPDYVQFVLATADYWSELYVFLVSLASYAYMRLAMRLAIHMTLDIIHVLGAVIGPFLSIMLLTTSCSWTIFNVLLFISATIAVFLDKCLYTDVSINGYGCRDEVMWIFLC